MTTRPPQHLEAAYRFGPFHLDVRERRLSRGSEAIPLRLKVPAWPLFLEELGLFLEW